MNSSKQSSAVSPRKGISTPMDGQTEPARQQGRSCRRGTDGAGRAPAASTSRQTDQGTDRNRLTIPPIWFV